MGIKFSNNASANIIRALTSTATSVSVTAGKGALFPSLTEGDYFYATLAGNNGLEIVKVTNRVNDTMTIVRAQDNTTALSFDTGDLFELRIVAADFNDTFSEVNDKLEASIEETTSIVNSAVSSKAPILHASSSTEYGAGSSTQYGHLKSHDAPDTTKTAANGHAFSPAGAAAMQEDLEGQIGDLTGVVEGNASRQDKVIAGLQEQISNFEAFPDQTNTEGQSLVSVGNKAAWWPLAQDILDAAEEAALGSEGEVGQATIAGLQASMTTLESSIGALENGVGRARAYITETWSSGANWIIKYSNGLIVQGGEFAAATSAQENFVLTLNCKFATDKYVFFRNPGRGQTYSQGDNKYTFGYKTKTENTVTMCVESTSRTPYFDWYACGY